MRPDCVTTPETPSSAGAGELIGTLETEAMFEVRVTVSLDLSRISVPISTVSHPAEDSIFPAEIGNRPRIVVFIVTAALSCHLGGVPSQRSFKLTIGNRGMSVFLRPFGGTGR